MFSIENTMFSIENIMFSIENNINKNQCFSQNIQCGSNIKDREGRDMDVISQTWCPVRLFGLELSGTNFFVFLTDFGQIRDFEANSWWSEDKKNQCLEKKSWFSKNKKYIYYGHQIWTPNSQWARSNPKSRKNTFFHEFFLSVQFDFLL